MIKNFRMRKYIARVLLPFLTIWLCVMPSRAYAFVPASIGAYGLPSAAEIAAASGGATAAATVGAVDLFSVGSLGLVIGATIGYLAIDYLFDGQTNTLRIPLTANPALAVPAPSAPSSKAPAYVYSVTYYTCSVSGYSDEAAAAEAFRVKCYPSLINAGLTVLNAGPPPSYYVHLVYSVGAPDAVVASVVPSLSCPTGYVASGSSCVLSVARQATPDRACDVERSGSALAMMNDVDCQRAGHDTMMAAMCTRGSEWICQGVKWVEGYPKPVNMIVTPNADGGTTITTYIPAKVGNTDVIDVTKTKIDSNGKVESVQGSTQTGTITPTATAPTTAIPVVAPTPGQAVISQTSPQASSTQPLTFPSDYARQGEAAAASNGIQTKLDVLHGDLTATTNTTDPTLPTVSDMPGWGSTFTSLVNWQLPAHSSACPTPSLDLSGVLGPGKVFVMNSHCTLINNHWQALNAAMTVVWSVLALFIVLRA